MAEMARMQVAFYGSTPNYAFIFDQVGHEGTTERLRERQKAGDLAGMAAVIGDDLLDEFVVTGTWDGIGAALADRYGGTATRVVDYFGAMAWVEDPGKLYGDCNGGFIQRHIHAVAGRIRDTLLSAR